MELQNASIASNASYASRPRYDISTACMLVFAIVGVVSNAALLISTLATKPFRKRSKLTAAFAFGTLICDLGAMAILAHRINVESHNGITTALECVINVPSILLYSVGEPIMTLCALIISVDYCLTVTVLNPAWRITEKMANILILTAIAVSSFNGLLTFILVYLRGSTKIRERCNQADIMDSLHIRINYCIVGLCSLVSTIIYMATAIIIAARKSAFPVVRLSQLRRQEAVMKHTSVVILIMLFSHIIPFFLIVILSFKNDDTLDSIIFFLYVIFSSAFPIRIFSAKLLPNGLLCRSKVATLHGKVSVETSHAM